MGTSTMVPLEEYLRTNYEPDRDWIDGELKERNMGDGPHSVVQTFFIKFFGNREEKWGIRVTQELRTQVSASHYRIPDVLLMRSDDPFEVIVRTPPLLCIEVLSPSDSMIEMEEKIEDYLAMGVEAVWVVNPRRQTAFVVDRGALLPVEELTVPGTEIRVAVADVFAELNALQARSR
jgi:Uma2 family endonuclease